MTQQAWNTLYRQFTKEALAKMTPNCGEKFSGQQIAAAKGQATRRMKNLGIYF